MVKNRQSMASHKPNMMLLSRRHISELGPRRTRIHDVSIQLSLFLWTSNDVYIHSIAMKNLWAKLETRDFSQFSPSTVYHNANADQNAISIGRKTQSHQRVFPLNGTRSGVMRSSTVMSSLEQARSLSNWRKSAKRLRLYLKGLGSL
jgi:hypothetical protein